MTTFNYCAAPTVGGLQRNSHGAATTRRYETPKATSSARTATTVSQTVALVAGPSNLCRLTILPASWRAYRAAALAGSNTVLHGEAPTHPRCRPGSGTQHRSGITGDGVRVSLFCR
jgi:hypothetical protein